MKNNLSIALQAVLLVAVAVLFYLHFSGGKNPNTTSHIPVAIPKEIKGSQIVFVNLDTLNEHYEYLKDLSASAKAQHQTLERQYMSQAQKLQDEFVTLQQNVQKGLFTEKEAMIEQELLLKKRGKLDEIEFKMQQLMDKIEEQNYQAQENLKSYIAEYNRTSNYSYVIAYTDNLPVVLFADPGHDITRDILDGLNQRYRAEKAAKKR